jgi:hypothetical protein
MQQKSPAVLHLYEELVEPWCEARPHQRNRFIVRFVPFLYRAVAPGIVLELVGHFYDCNSTCFEGTRSEHMKEAEAMLRGVVDTYASELSDVELQIYEVLRERDRDAFRIFRDLASRKEGSLPGIFFMAIGHLGDRLGIKSMQAQRVMKRLLRLRLIALVERGTRRSAGVRGTAGCYQWLLPVPVQKGRDSAEWELAAGSNLQSPVPSESS